MEDSTHCTAPADAPSLPRALRERGASLVEYAFLVALIAIVCITAVAFFGGESSNSLSTSGESISAN